MTDTGEEMYNWVDAQTAEQKPAVLMIYDGDDDTEGFVYLANAPAFDMPAIVALNVPHELATRIGNHLDFLCQRHLDGHPVKDGHISADAGKDFEMYFQLVKPNWTTKRKLMSKVLCQTKYRWPKADVLLLMPYTPPEVTVH